LDSFQRLGRLLSSSVLVTVMRMLPLFIVSQKIGASSRFQNKNLLTHIPRVYYMRLHQQQSKFFRTSDRTEVRKDLPAGHKISFAGLGFIFTWQNQGQFTAGDNDGLSNSFRRSQTQARDL